MLRQLPHRRIGAIIVLVLLMTHYELSRPDQHSENSYLTGSQRQDLVAVDIPIRPPKPPKAVRDLIHDAIQVQSCVDQANSEFEYQKLALYTFIHRACKYSQSFFLTYVGNESPYTVVRDSVPFPTFAGIRVANWPENWPICETELDRSDVALTCWQDPCRVFTGVFHKAYEIASTIPVESKEKYWEIVIGHEILHGLGFTGHDDSNPYRTEYFRADLLKKDLDKFLEVLMSQLDSGEVRLMHGCDRSASE